VEGGHNFGWGHKPIYTITVNYCYNMPCSRSRPAFLHLFALRYEWAQVQLSSSHHPCFQIWRFTTNLQQVASFIVDLGAQGARIFVGGGPRPTGPF